jgi:hypothetical protein
MKSSTSTLFSTEKKKTESTSSSSSVSSGISQHAGQAYVTLGKTERRINELKLQLAMLEKEIGYFKYLQNCPEQKDFDPEIATFKSSEGNYPPVAKFTPVSLREYDRVKKKFVIVEIKEEDVKIYSKIADNPRQVSIDYFGGQMAAYFNNPLYLAELKKQIPELLIEKEEIQHALQKSMEELTKESKELEHLINALNSCSLTTQTEPPTSHEHRM